MFASPINISPALATPTAEPATPDAALPGQIVVNPADRRWFSYNRDADGDGKLDPFYWAGPGGPEDFLYRGTRQADGTRSGDQMDIVNHIGSAGANAIYFQIVRSHGGDGDSNHNPFNNNDPNQPLNRTIVTQWNIWLSELEARGIVVYLALYDDGADSYRTSTMSAAEKAFVDEIVNQLERHTNIVWGIAEEYSEAFGNYPGRLSQITAEIRAADDYDHPISIHHLQGDTTMDIRSDPNVNQFAMQSDGTSPAEVYADVLAGYQDAAGRWNVNMSERRQFHCLRLTTGRGYRDRRSHGRHVPRGLAGHPHERQSGGEQAVQRRRCHAHTPGGHWHGTGGVRQETNWRHSSAGYAPQTRVYPIHSFSRIVAIMIPLDMGHSL